MRRLHHMADRISAAFIAGRAQAPVRSDLNDLAVLAGLADQNPRALFRSVAAPHIGFAQIPNSPTTGRFAFDTPVSSGHVHNDRVHGERWLAGAAPSQSAVIMLHGGFAPSWSAERIMARPFLARGLDVFVLALPWHMERAPVESAYSGQYLLSGDVPRLIHGFSQGAHDTAALAFALEKKKQAIFSQPCQIPFFCRIYRFQTNKSTIYFTLFLRK